jgi:MoaA/NifB/PqqE/SkfB family radical SAM enzyme
MTKVAHHLADIRNKVGAVLRYPEIASSMMYRQSLYRFYKNHWLHRGKVLTLPCEIVALISRKCFLNCVTCGTKAMYGSDERFTDFFELDYLKKMADELATWRSPKYVKMTGGEPTMHPDFVEIMQYYSYKKVPIRLSTNGVSFKVKENANALVDAGVDVVTISIDGMPGDHDRIRQGQNLFKTLTEGIANIKERRAQIKSKKPLIQVATIISKNNHAHLAEFVRELGKIGVDWLHLGFIQYMREDWGKASEAVCHALGGVGDDKWKFWKDNPLANVGMDMQVLEMNLTEIFSERQGFPISMLKIGGQNKEALERWHYSDDQIWHSLCANPYVSMVVLSPGHACFCIDFPQFYYGDVREASMKDIWFSRKAADYRKRFYDHYREHKKNLPHCNRCCWRFW